MIETIYAVKNWMFYVDSVSQNAFRRMPRFTIELEEVSQIAAF
jgi:hypothetical protein